MIITVQCSLCGKKENYELDKNEQLALAAREAFGREAGTLQDLFPKIPAWIRSGAIDEYSGGFCICPKCGG